MTSLPIQSSNPILNDPQTFNPFAFREQGAIEPATTTMAGIINKTILLCTMAIAAGAAGYWLFTTWPGTLWIGSIASAVMALGIFFLLRGKPHLAKFYAPVYAIVQGSLLGGITGILEQMLVARFGQSVPGGLAFQALLVTGGAAGAVLLLYKAGIVRPTRTFTAIISTAMLGIAIAYLLSFVLSFFGMNLPFISLGSVFDSGTAGWIGLGLNLVILGIAAFSLVMDLGMIEHSVENGAPKDMEWYCAFGLLVTLAWIYFEAVKLIVRVAAIMGQRR